MSSVLWLLAALPAAPGLSNYDAFAQSTGTPPAAHYSSGARARIEAGWISNQEPRLGVPTFFWAPRPPQQARTLREAGLTAEQAARRWLYLYGELYRQDPEALAAQPVHEVHDVGDGAVIVRFRKSVAGVPVFRDTLNVVMTQGLQLVALSGYLSPYDQPREFKLAANTAFAVALQDATGEWLAPSKIRGLQQVRSGWEEFVLQTTAASGGARARKVLFPLADRLEAAWQLELTVVHADGSEDSYSYAVSAEDGRLLLRNDLTAHAQYRVWADTAAPFTPWDGPQGTAPTPNQTGLLDGYQAPALPAQLVTVESIAPVTDPWLPAGATVLTGNNVEAYADVNFPNGFNDADSGHDGGTPDAGFFYDGGADLRVPASMPGVFDWSYDLTRNADFAVSQRHAGGVSAFYVTNWAHDVLYARGFDEKAGNGQRNNFSRGGLDSDALLLEVHDYKQRNNASMTTPSDGKPGRLQAYLFDPSGPSTVALSSDGGPLDGGALPAGWVDFGPQQFDLTAPVVRGYDGFDAGWDGCDGPLLNAAEVSGNIVLFEPTRCGYFVSINNAADAGAVGVLITGANQGLATFTGPPTSLGPPALILQRDAGLQLGRRLDAGEATVARMFRPFVPEKDSALDNAIIAHEYTHFLTNRLVGDGNGLVNQSAKSLGEGWSDFFSLWMMVRESDAQAPNNASWKGLWAAGSFATSGTQFSGAGNAAYYLGVRRYPYSIDFTRNGLTFRHLQLGQALPLVPGAPFGINTEVHAAGEVWCQMLWEGFAAMLNDSRFTFGQAHDRMLSYLVASLKVTPVLPTFLEARDAVLAVMAARDPQDLALWTQAFARRGIGFKATGPDRFTIDNKPIVEDYLTAGNFLRIASVKVDDAPGYCDKDGVLDSGEQGTLTVSLLNVGAAALSNTTVTVTTTAPGVAFANGGKLTFGPMGSFAPGSASVELALTGATAVSFLPLELTVADPALNGSGFKQTFVVRANTDVVPAVTEHCEGNVDAWTADVEGTGSIPSEWYFLAREVGNNQKAFVGPNAPFKTDSYLVTPLLDVGSAPLVVTFTHQWSFEKDTSQRTWDGARLEVSTDDAVSWLPVPSAALTPGYNGAVFATSAASLQGEPAWVGSNAGYPASPVTQTVNLGTQYAGQRLRLRSHISTDGTGGAPGWTVDDVVFSGITNQPFFDLISDRAQCQNRPPKVSLGADRSVDERTLVDLMPTVSDPDGQTPTQTWSQLSGPPVTFSGNTFTAPEVTSDTVLGLRLTASDGTLSGFDDLELTVKQVNRPPTASAGDPKTVDSGAKATLQGAGEDPDGDSLIFGWTQTAGPTVAIMNPNAAQTEFTAPQVSTSTVLTFELVVSDGKIDTAPASVDVTVIPPKGCGCSGAPDAFGLLALGVALRAWRRGRRVCSDHADP